VSIIQYVEDLSDRQVAEQIPVRLDWKYLLGLEVEEQGFHYSVLSEFRERVIAGGMEAELLETLLKVFKEAGLLKKGGQQRTDSTHVVGAVRRVNRWEMLGETMRAALNDLATVAPAWLQGIAPLEWYKRYERRIEIARLPKGKADRAAWIQAIGEDGIYLLEQLYESAERHWLREIPAVRVLRQVWLHQFYYQDDQLQVREKENLPPASIRFDSPYDPEVHYSTKRNLEWSGYKVHLTETCDPDQPHLIIHVETTPAPQPDVTMTAPIHQALAEKDCLPQTHLVDAGYVDADSIVESREQPPVMAVTTRSSRLVSPSRIVALARSVLVVPPVNRCGSSLFALKPNLKPCNWVANSSTLKPGRKPMLSGLVSRAPFLKLFVPLACLRLATLV
jgi:transposase